MRVSNSKLDEIQRWAFPERPDWLADFIYMARELQNLRRKIAFNEITDTDRERCRRTFGPRHVCGAQGYGVGPGGLHDTCSGCEEENRRRQWDAEHPEVSL